MLSSWVTRYTDCFGVVALWCYQTAVLPAVVLWYCGVCQAGIGWCGYVVPWSFQAVVLTAVVSWYWSAFKLRGTDYFDVAAL